MKSPPIQYTDTEAHDMVEAFIKEGPGEKGQPEGAPVALTMKRTGRPRTKRKKKP